MHALLAARVAPARLLLVSALVAAGCGSSERPHDAAAPGTAGSTFTVRVSRPEGGTITSSASASGGRIACGTQGGDANACAEMTVPVTQAVTLEAAADPGFKFVGWFGDCAGTAPTCTLDAATSLADKWVVAAFLPDATYRGIYFLVTVARPTGGTVTSGDGRIRCGPAAEANVCGPALYRWSETVTLTATPDAGHAFAGWGGDCSGAGPCALSTEPNGTDKEVTAAFAPTYRVRGTVTGLAGSGLVLRNGADEVAVLASGTFEFTTALPAGNTYDVTVAQQPPNQACTVSNGSGTVLTADVANVAVVCQTTTFAVGGSASGITSPDLSLSLSSSSVSSSVVLPVGATGFVFPDGLPTGATYHVDVARQPSGASVVCLVSNGDGTVGTSPVDGVAVTCRSIVPSIVTSDLELMAVKNGGALVAWGESPELLNGAPWRSTATLTATGVATAGLRSHVAAVKADGTLWTWGFNHCGELGDGTITDRSTPKQIGSGFKMVAVGRQPSTTYGDSEFDAAIKTDGTLWTWGCNSAGGLGDGTSATFRTRPAQIGTGFSFVDAGNEFAVALKTDGTLWAWGTNRYGQLGDGTTTSRATPVQIGADFAHVAASAYHVVAVKRDGTLWAWGLNEYGEVGDGTFVNRATPRLIGTGFALAAAGVSHSLAVKTDGTLYGWGLNHLGQVGTGDARAMISKPVPVGSGFAAAYASANGLSVGLKPDGSMWVWGFYSGQLFGASDFVVPTRVYSLGCAPGTCKRVFATSQLYTSNLGGLAGADAKCQALADAAGLGGTYRAWLSTVDGASPWGRFTFSEVPYVRIDGVEIAKRFANGDGLTRNGPLEAAISVTEVGGAVPRGTNTLGGLLVAPVWSETSWGGGSVGLGDCGAWTGGAGQTELGDATRADGMAWTFAAGANPGCSGFAALYCFEQ